MNERKTENIVRSHFNADTAIVRIEEQSSEIAKVSRLLSGSSKHGSGRGRPEFIITFNCNSDFLIVVECKADRHKHESVTGACFSEFAVDGVLAELAQINRNSVVYDNCTGTGGFLISAMKYMVQDAAGDSAKVREIKSRQLLGVEYQAHIYALAVSNMYIHQDGKTGVINGDCFDEQIINQIRNQKPTTGMLNPPYKTGVDEFEFILNNLECLSDGGVCIAIVPMNKAIDKRSKTLTYKRTLLQKHTLEAVFSMPE